MSDWAKKALASEDATQIKLQRTIAKRIFTTSVNTIRKGCFDKLVGETDYDLVEKTFDEVISHYSTAKEIHQRYVLYRSEGADETEENKALEEDEEWMTAVLEKFQSVTKEFNDYKEKWEQHRKSASADAVEKDNVVLKTEFDAVMKIAKETSTATSKEKKRTAEENKKSVKEIFSAMRAGYCLLYTSDAADE